MAADLRRRLRVITDFGDNVSSALDSIRSAKGRSALTVLGVVIGVSCVMAMATIVRGIQDQIMSTLEIAGPSTLYVVKVFSQTPLNPENLPRWVRVRPDVSLEEAERIRALPEIAYASLWGQMLNRIEYAGVRTNLGIVTGADEGYTEIYGGDLISGRWFARGELQRGESVVVLAESVAHKLFGSIPPLERWVRIGGRPAMVVGIYRPASNIFSPPGQEQHAIVPYRMLDRQFAIDKTNSQLIPVKPRAGVDVEEARGSVIIAMREIRRLHPSDSSNFDVVSQDQLVDLVFKLSGAFVLVMMVLSGVGLMVGGVGVMAVMMISVTDRTREIGLRKAVGATPRDILQQFLVEAATLTAAGGLIGIAVGVGVGYLATRAMKITAAPPLDLTAVAVVVSVGIGLLFGLLPARRAARLDPVEALRHE
jgi:putative ABC transport system permease protein